MRGEPGQHGGSGCPWVFTHRVLCPPRTKAPYSQKPAIQIKQLLFLYRPSILALDRGDLRWRWPILLVLAQERPDRRRNQMWIGLVHDYSHLVLQHKLSQLYEV